MSFSSSSSSSRVIVHLDLDAFYAQVETRRLHLANDQPCCVQQWNSLIAVNYPARLWGISRFDKAKDAKRKCPFVKLVHTETIGDITSSRSSSSHLNEQQKENQNTLDKQTSELTTATTQHTDTQPYTNCTVNTNNKEEEEEEEEEEEVSLQEGCAVNYTEKNLQSKVSLARYRKASKRIFELLEAAAGSENVEKAGLDEAFIDVTGIVSDIRKILLSESAHFTMEDVMGHAKECVNLESFQQHQLRAAQAERKKRLEKWFAEYPDKCIMEDEAFALSEEKVEDFRNAPHKWIQIEEKPKWWCIPHTVLSERNDTMNISAKFNSKSFLDQSIILGAHVAQRLRDTILQRLGYTTGVGVAHNKMLAKVGSARNKPDQQTLITSQCINQVMHDLPIDKIRFLGGKIGKQLMQSFQVRAAGEARHLSKTQLQKVFDESTSEWLYRVVRGEDSSEVQPRQNTKSMLSVKSISPVKTYVQAYPWLRVLSDEICDRVMEELKENDRYPKTLTINYRRTKNPTGNYMGKSKTGTMPSSHALSKEELFKVSQRLLHSIPSSEVFPCNRFALGASNFIDLHIQGFQNVSTMLKKRHTASTDAEPTSTTETQKNEKESSGEPTTCPVCNQRIDVLSMLEMNEHIDTCLEGSAPPKDYCENLSNKARKRSRSSGKSIPDIRSMFQPRNNY